MYWAQTMTLALGNGIEHAGEDDRHTPWLDKVYTVLL